MGKNKSKQPSFNAMIAKNKTPIIAEDPRAWLSQKPIWKFSKFDSSGCRWSFDKIDQGDIVKILGRLKDLENNSWQEINNFKSHGDIEISNPKIDKAAKNRLTQLNLEPDNLYHFRVGYSERIWGIRDGAELYLLWWDKDHSVYPL